MNSTKLKYFPMLALMVLLVACGPKKPRDMTAELSSLPAVSNMKIHYLDNGLQVVLLEDHSKRQVDMYLLYKAGNRNETKETSGLAHLTEHTMYTGSRNVAPKEHDKLIKSARAQPNAYTRTDYTLFYNHALPVDKLELGLRLEADRMGWPRFDPERFKWEKDALIREEEGTYSMKMVAEGKLKDLAYERHSYGVGLGEDRHTQAANLSLEDCKTFHSSYYTPNNAVLVLAGSFQEEEAMALVKKHFGAVPRGRRSPNMRNTEPKQTAQRQQRIKTNAIAPQSRLAFHVPNFSHKDNYALQVLRQFLYGAIKSKAQLQGLDRNFTVHAEAALDPGLFIITYGVNSESDRTATERVVFEAISQLQNITVRPQDLSDVKRAVGSRFMDKELMIRPYMSIASTIGEYVLYGDVDHLLHYDERIDAVTADDVQRVANKYLIRDNMSALYLSADGEQAAPQAGTANQAPKLVFGYTLKPANNGVRVSAIKAGGAAEKAGFQVGDVVVKIFSYPTRSMSEYELVVSFLKQGRKSFHILRNGEKKTLLIDLVYEGQKPPAVQKTTTPSHGSDIDFGYEVKAVKGGMQMTKIKTGGAAEKAGFKVGDVLVKILDYPTRSEGEYMMVIGFLKSGTKAFHIVRDGEKKTLNITLGATAQNQPVQQQPVAPKIFIGIRVDQAAQAGGGVRITDMTEGGPALKAGLKAGDVIIKIGDEACTDYDTLKSMLPTLSAGKTPFVLRRDGVEQTIIVDIAVRK